MHDIEFILQEFDLENCALEKIAANGSGRINYKVVEDNKTFILTINDNIAENESFFYLTEHLNFHHGNIPKVLKISKNRKSYLQTFVGDKTLLQLKMDNINVEELYTKSVRKLAELQINAEKELNLAKLYDFTTFNHLLVYRDLFYFKNYFLDFTDLEYTQSKLLFEFEKLKNKIAEAKFIYFIFRDFQGRNILINNNEPYFIDYQDGMIGPIAYDLVSLLWQAKANLSLDEKEKYYKVYTNQLKSILQSKFAPTQFRKEYNTCLILRLLQVLGAYGKLGLIQKKPHFIESIQYGIHNLKTINQQTILDEYPTLKYITENLNINSIKI